MNTFNLDFEQIREKSKSDLNKLLAEINADDSETLKLAACCKAAETALGLTAFDEQLIAAVALYSNRVVEMKTGEGKTLSAVFAAFLLKTQNTRVHIFTFNDYLAKRDYNWMKPVYDLLKADVALITEKTSFEDRKKAYGTADVIYSTVKECGFDFLRDFMVYDHEHTLHTVTDSDKDFRFDFAIFDEADSILIDEARIPLVIAGDVEATVSDEFKRTFEFVKTLDEKDYAINHETMSVFLTDNGMEKTEKEFDIENLYDEENIELRCNIETCLKALFYLSENKDYVVKDGRIQLIDALTGRIAQNRLLPGTLQAAVEAKHGLAVTERGVVTGIIPIQFFARQYSEIAGMTGTAVASEEEFRLLYGLEVEVIPPHTPSKRVDNPIEIYYNADAKWNAVTKRAVSCYKKGQPVLIGTSSIKESETLAELLSEAGIENVAVLNAKNDEMEAEIIKNAGQFKAVTVSTNMAGRGIDIKLGGFDEASRDDVIKAGGMHIIGTALYENARMNEQLNGRSGRQGDIGETSLFTALDDDIMVKHDLVKGLGRHYKKLVKKYDKDSDAKIDEKVVYKEVERIQRIAQSSLLEDRKRLLKFTMIGEKHRDIIFKKRFEYLTSESDECVIGGITAPREVILSAINELWCDYLEYTSELRTGIHLRAVGGRNPSEEYNIDCETYFEGMQGRLIDKVEATLQETDIKENGNAVLFKPKNARTFLMEESGDELVRKPILLNVFREEDEYDD